MRVYFGETFRNGATRSAEHIKDRDATNLLQVKKSVMNKHRVDEHDGENVEFKMQKVQNFVDIFIIPVKLCKHYVRRRPHAIPHNSVSPETPVYGGSSTPRTRDTTRCG